MGFRPNQLIRLTQRSKAIYHGWLLCLILPLLLMACMNRMDEHTPPDVPPDAPRYLALGDSYTIGERVVPELRWPVQLAEMLRQKGIAISDPQIIAKTGWTTDDLQDGIVAVNPQGPYDFVSLLIGVNNQYRGYPADEYRQEFAALLDQAIAFADGDAGRMVVLSIPDWGVTPFAEGRDRQKIGAQIDAFNAINRDESERRDVAYVDVTSISRKAGQDAALIAEDGLHPSGKMYTEWARLALPIVQELLDEKDPE